MRGNGRGFENVWELAPSDEPDQAAARWLVGDRPALSAEVLLEDPWKRETFRSSWVERGAATPESRQDTARRLAEEMTREELEGVLVSAMESDPETFNEAVEAPGIASAVERLIDADFLGR